MKSAMLCIPGDVKSYDTKRIRRDSLVAIEELFYRRGVFPN